MGISRVALIGVCGAALCLGARTQESNSVRSRLLQLDQQFAVATSENGLEGYLSYLEENASVVPETGPVVSGKEGIRRLYSKMFADPDFKMTWRPVESMALSQGDLGFTWGHYEALYRDKEGELHVQRGQYTSLWRKQADGS